MISAAKILNELHARLVGETPRTKRKCDELDLIGKPTKLPLLRPHFEMATTDGDIGSSSVKTSVFKPAWGIRKHDLIVGDTKHSKDWSYHSIPSPDYRDFVISRDLEAVESLGCEDLATVFSSLFLVFLFS